MHYLEIFHDVNFIYEQEASFMPASEVAGPECASPPGTAWVCFL